MKQSQLDRLKPEMLKALKNKNPYPYFFFVDSEDNREKCVVISKLTINQIKNLTVENIQIVS